MTLSQKKIDLAVLYKLHQHAEQGGGDQTSADVARLFKARVPFRRVEVALQELEKSGDVENEYHPFYTDEGGLWQISREGMARVDRALRVPTSFIARLHSNTDVWLESEEAEKAVLKKLSDAQPRPEVPVVVLDKVISRPAERHIDWGKWGAIAGLAAIPLAIILWYFS